MSVTCTRAFSLTVSEPVNPLWPYNLFVERVGPYATRLRCSIVVQVPQPIVRCYRSSNSGATWTLMGFFSVVSTIAGVKLEEITVTGLSGAMVTEPDTEYWWRWQLDDGSIMPGHIVQRTWPRWCTWQDVANVTYCDQCEFVDGFPEWDGRAEFNGSYHSGSFYQAYLFGAETTQFNNMRLTLFQCYKPGGANDPNWSLLLQCDDGTNFIEAAKAPQTDILNPPQGTYIVTTDLCGIIGVGNPITILGSAT